MPETRDRLIDEKGPLVTEAKSTAHGRHWLADAVLDGEGAFTGDLAELLLEQTQPFEPPTVQFSRADFEFAVKLDRAIAAARIAEQRRLNPTRWGRVRRCVRGWLR